MLWYSKMLCNYLNVNKILHACEPGRLLSSSAVDKKEIKGI